jgi:hypothetical protein
MENLKLSKKEWYRNNNIFYTDLFCHLKFEADLNLENGDGLLYIRSRIHDDLLCANKNNYLVAIDNNIKKILWEKEGHEETNVPYEFERDKIYTSWNDGIGCLRKDDLCSIWEVKVNEVIKHSSEEYLFCLFYEEEKYDDDDYLEDDEEDKGDILICRSKQTGEEVWRVNTFNGFIGSVLCENNIVVVKCSEGFYVYDINTGSLILEISFVDYLKKYFPEISDCYYTVGPLIEGILYLGIGQKDYDKTQIGGLLVAINAKTEELVWSYELKKYHDPRTIIFKDGKLYFDIDQGWGGDNYLTCVDAKTGTLVFKTEENFTPAGCCNPIIVNNYFVGGDGRYLSFFDLEKQEFVWRYKHKKNVSIFGNGLNVYKDQLIAHSVDPDKIYWFKSCPPK